jgi:hypothetical protein
VTGKVVNLNRARKTRARDDRKRQADANAAKHGRTRAERTRDQHEANRARQVLDDHVRDQDPQ